MAFAVSTWVVDIDHGGGGGGRCIQSIQKLSNHLANWVPRWYSISITGLIGY